MTVYDALYAVGGPTPFARAADSYVVRAGERIELDAARSGTATACTATCPCSRATKSWSRPPRCSSPGGPTREADLGLVHFVDKTGRSLRGAALDAPVTNGDILIVERQVILRLLEGIQRVAPIISLFNNTATAINTVSDWIDPSP